MGGKSGLGEFEQLVLLIVVRLSPDAFAPEITEALDSQVGRAVTRGALYSTLNRLESKGFLTWDAEQIKPGQRGHIRRRFAITEVGLDALRQRRDALLTLWDGIEHVIDGRGT